MSSPIPEARRAAVERALQAAFGTPAADSVAALHGGLSGAQVFRIRVGGIPYVLRLEGARDAFRDPHRWHRCMQTAAAAFVAPRVRYADAADGVTVVDFIPERSLAMDYAGSRGDLIAEAAQTLRALHETPAFPPLVDYLDGLQALVDGFRPTGAPAAADALSAGLAALRDAWRSDPEDLVSSHNDLNPRNILYDGARLWFVDWESAFRADRYVDLACLANFLTAGDAEADALLRVYFGQAPDARRRARLFLMRQANHLFYAVSFLAGAAAERPGAPLPQAPTPSLAELHQAVALGEITLARREDRVAYGRARLAAAADALASPAFAAARRAAA